MNPKADSPIVVKELLASLIGVEAEDIKNEDYLDEDLHMGPAEISDFLVKMQEKGLNVSNLEKPSELTVGEIEEIINE